MIADQGPLREPTWLDALAAHLAEHGLGTWSESTPYTDGDEWPIYLEHVPAEPDHVIVLTGYGGTATSVDAEPSVQVRVRGDRDPRTSRTRAEAIWTHLRGLIGGAPLSDGTWLVQAPDVNGAVVALGPDALHRHQHVTNHRLTLSPKGGD